MGKPVYVLGGGGHGRVVVDTLLASGALVAGILDAGLDRSTTIFGVPVLGGEECLLELDPTAVLLANGVGANPRVAARAALFDRVKDRGFDFATIRHPSATFASECLIEEGAQIMAGVVLQNRVIVGANAVLNTAALVDHDTLIGPNAFVAPGATLCGNVAIAANAFVGAGAVVLPGVCVGSAAIVGAGAVVTRDVDEAVVVAGNPARIVRSGR